MIDAVIPPLNSDFQMEQASCDARETFKYFWRELSWENRRIIPSLDLACIKVGFETNLKTANSPSIEYLWVDNIEYDGESVSGNLVNSPQYATHLSIDQQIKIARNNISDWLFANRENVFGGFTIQLLRSRMTKKERLEHDQQWHLNFGDPNEIRIAYDDTNRERYTINPTFTSVRDAWVAPLEHPMCEGMAESLKQYIDSDRTLIESQDNKGWALIHNEALAGNLGTIKTIVEYGHIDPQIPTTCGKTAASIAFTHKWDHIVEYLCT